MLGGAAPSDGGGQHRPASDRYSFIYGALLALSNALDQLKDLTRWPEAAGLRALAHQRLHSAAPMPGDDPVAAALLLDLVGCVLFGYMERVFEPEARARLTRDLAQLHSDKDQALRLVPISKARYGVLKTEILAALMRNRDELVAELQRVQQMYDSLKAQEKQAARQLDARLQSTHAHVADLQRTAEASVTTLRQQLDAVSERAVKAEGALASTRAQLDESQAKSAVLEHSVAHSARDLAALQAHLAEAEQRHAADVQAVRAQCDARVRTLEDAMGSERREWDAVKARAEKAVATAVARSERAEHELERARAQFKADMETAVQRAAIAAEEMAREDAQANADVVDAQHAAAIDALRADGERRLAEQRGEWEAFMAKAVDEARATAAAAAEERVRLELAADAEQRTEAALLLERAASARKIAVAEENLAAAANAKAAQESKQQLESALQAQAKAWEEYAAKAVASAESRCAEENAAAAEHATKQADERVEQALQVQAKAWEEYAAKAVASAESRWAEERASMERALVEAQQPAAVNADGADAEARLASALAEQGRAWEAYARAQTEALQRDLDEARARAQAAEAAMARGLSAPTRGINDGSPYATPTKAATTGGGGGGGGDDDGTLGRDEPLDMSVQAAASPSMDRVVADELVRDNAVLREQLQAAEARLNKALEQQAAAWKDFAEKRAADARQEEAARWAGKLAQTDDARAHPRRVDEDVARAVQAAVSAAQEACEEERRRQVDALQKEHARQLSRLVPGEAQAKRVVAAAALTLADMERVSHESGAHLDALAGKALRCAALRAAAREREVFAQGLLRLGGSQTPRRALAVPAAAAAAASGGDDADAKAIQGMLFSDVHF